IASNLQAESRACRVRLTWQNAPGAGTPAGWQVFRNTVDSPTGAAVLTSLPPSTLTYDDAPPARDVPYFYFVRGFNPVPACVSGGPLSASVTGRLLPLQIASLSAQTSNCSRVNLTWPVVPDATSYSVQRQAVGGAIVEIGQTTVAVFADTTGIPGTRYFYGVYPQTPCGNAPGSGAAEIVFPGPPTPAAPANSIVRSSNTRASIQFNIATFGLPTTLEILKDNSPLPLGGRISLSGQQLIIDPVQLEDIGEYTLRLTSAACAASASQSAVIAVKNPCPADINESGARDVADIFAFLSAWFAGCP
ncbi:MAG: hypothetical protein K2Q20_11220, partial [Phycisphaerales bacterium]|nr:hypothetical protein [Phycisphaerales bacterium]